MRIHIHDKEEEGFGGVATGGEPFAGEAGDDGVVGGFGGGGGETGTGGHGDGVVVVVVEAAGIAEAAVGHGVGGDADGLVAGVVQNLSKGGGVGGVGLVGGTAAVAWWGEGGEE